MLTRNDNDNDNDNYNDDDDDDRKDNKKDSIFSAKDIMSCFSLHIFESH